MAGDVQAKAGGRNPASTRRTKDATSDTAASYAISDEPGARKKTLDNWQRTAVNRGLYG